VKKPRHPVSDHAVLRYLERAKGVDVEAVRRELGHRVDELCDGHQGMCSVLIEGLRLILSDEGVVVTVMHKHRPPAGKGRPKRRERS
jgi:hypothetical protein